MEDFYNLQLRADIAKTVDGLDFGKLSRKDISIDTYDNGASTEAYAIDIVYGDVHSYLYVSEFERDYDLRLLRSKASKKSCKQKRTFYKTVIQVEVLSEYRLEYNNLDEIAYAISEGGCSGVVKMKEEIGMSGKKMAKELIAQKSDPEFFELSKNGKDLQ